MIAQTKFSGLFVMIFCLASGLVRAQPTVSFDWFEYQGRDAVFEQPLLDGHYRNPIIAGFHPDPSIVRVGDDYYLVNSSFAWFPGLPVFHSTDLVNWQQIGHGLSRRSQLTFENGQGISRGIFAPTIRYHDGLFYIITTDVDGIGNFYITAEDPAGPWSDPVTLPLINGIDPDLFFDENGRAYIAHNGEPEGPALYDGHRAVWLWEFDLSTGQVKPATGRVIVNGGVDLSSQPVWIEGPHIYKVNGWYYLLCAEGGTSDEHSQVAFRTRSLDEPFVPYEHNPVLTQRDLDPDRNNPITSVGHADLVQTAEGDWWSVFLGVRPYTAGYYNTGRETFLLPVSWQNDWPMILEPGVAVPWQVALPKTGPDQRGVTAAGSIPPQAGNFIWRDDFDQTDLNFEWIRPRTSATDFVQLDAAAGKLRLNARPTGLEEKTQPALLARVQQHIDFTASASLELPLADGVSAGLVLFQSSDFNYFFGVRKSQQHYTLFLEKIRDGVRTTIAQQAMGNLHNAEAETKTGTGTKTKTETETETETGTETGTGTGTGTGKTFPLILEAAQQGEHLEFRYRLASGQTHSVANGTDAKLLSTKQAGGFVGAVIGLYARLDEP